ncbi:MAG: aldo/keto reductase [Candidatus Andeanibacterium colombiense]|uniref:Aldo/keto reductase n=1 Tax=Candidatus Andeanibacterium colombiense TaxID=3121345 RepID=A0AAJ6BMV8_9SPHN|nr:MAG: aldo/keto reductase [Sphingomonadaceae bacterium]
MRYKVFGRTGLRVSQAALGTATFGTAWGWGCTPGESRVVFDRFVEAGGNFLDCADGYQNGESETILGDLIAHDRDHFIVSTKYTTAVGMQSIAKTGNSRKAMMASIEGSLQRLKTDFVDIYWVHMPDLVTPTDEIIRGLEDLVRAGKTRYIGMSDFPAWRVSRALTQAEIRGTEPLAAIQVEMSLAERTVEREFLPLAQAYGLAIMAWSPLGGGTLSGKYRDKNATGRVTQGGGPVRQIPEDRREAIVAALDEVAAVTGTSPAQVAIAWVVAKEPLGTAMIPVLGARTVEQLDQNIAAFDFTLTPEQVALLDRASFVPLGFPHELMADPAMRSLHTGGYWDRLDEPAIPRP